MVSKNRPDPEALERAREDARRKRAEAGLPTEEEPPVQKLKDIKKGKVRK